MNKQGILVVNAFISTPGFSDAYERLGLAARRNGVTLSLKTNAELVFDAANGRLLNAKLPDFAVFWDKDVRLALQLEAAGVRLYNSARAIALCDDKALTHIALQKARIPMPKTVVAPFTYPKAGYGDFLFLHEAEKLFSYPMVVKEVFGSYGKQVYLAQNAEEVKAILKKTGDKPVLLQEFISESAGTDIRAIVVGEKIVASMKRKNDRDFRANLSIGGTAEPYTLTSEEAFIVRKAAKELGLDFCGVDILNTKNGPLICEVNSNAQFRGIFQCTGVDAAEHIMQYIMHQEKMV
ncbi:MAG TPA: RimK family alpha-L-glutamate ligase [Clostridia bacterium]|nr:RimK family alpha-L-glutamate ligase [Clostridia bacterium]